MFHLPPSSFASFSQYMDAYPLAKLDSTTFSTAFRVLLERYEEATGVRVSTVVREKQMFSWAGLVKNVTFFPDFGQR